MYCYVLNHDWDGEWRLRESNSSMMKSVCLCGLPRLKEVLVLGIRDVCVDSPCLEILEYFPGWEEPYKIDFENCKNLKELDLSGLESTIITSKWFLELFAKFPFLETVKLERCLMSNRINISSVQLKVLSLISCPNLKELSIDAPNLLSCEFEDCAENSISFQRCSSQLKVKAMIHIHHLNFYYFRKFIQNYKHLSVLTSVSLCFYDLMVALDLFNFQLLSIPPLPPSVKHLNMVVLLKNEALYLPLVYGLLSNCSETTISVSVHGCCRKFIEFLYEALMERDEFRRSFCYQCHFGHSKYSKCWLHSLKDVKLESPMKIVTKVDFKNMLDKLENSPHHLRNTISFKLES